MVTRTSTISPPPLSPYGIMQGSMFQYHRNLVAFESSPSPDVSTKNKCILIGGLSDGLLPTPYTKQLEDKCHKLGWSLVQPLISSSYTGFGHGTLERDTSELTYLLSYLTHHMNGEKYAFVGHSTGCQNAVHLLKYGSEKNLCNRIKVVALQAPVSDREHGMMENRETYDRNLNIAQKLQKDGKEREMMPSDVFWAPITVERFLHLQERGNVDDFFSSDYTDTELIERLSHVSNYETSGLHLLAAFSGSDEYVPSTVNGEDLVRRLCNAMNDKCTDRMVARPLYLPNANHNLSQAPGDGETFVDEVGNLLLKAAEVES